MRPLTAREQQRLAQLRERLSLRAAARAMGIAVSTAQKYAKPKDDVIRKEETETAAILADATLMLAIQRGIREMEQGLAIPWEEARQKIIPNVP